MFWWKGREYHWHTATVADFTGRPFSLSSFWRARHNAVLIFLWEILLLHHDLLGHCVKAATFSPNSMWKTPSSLARSLHIHFTIVVRECLTCAADIVRQRLREVHAESRNLCQCYLSHNLFCYRHLDAEKAAAAVVEIPVSLIGVPHFRFRSSSFTSTQSVARRSNMASSPLDPTIAKSKRRRGKKWNITSCARWCETEWG